VPEEKLGLARAVLLLSPQIPLLFMGEEWSASAPFQFFVDFPDEALCKAVRDGRRKEFSKFERFNGKGFSIPDPSSADTFCRSKPDWSERNRAPHAAVLSDVRELLVLRRAEIVPLLVSEFRGGVFSLPHDAALAVSWRFSAGNLRLVMNFGNEVVEVSLAGDERVIWCSEPAVRDDRLVDLPRWTGVLTASAP
jgi:maltooligosyltrehalose trehalohydrolase